MLLNIVKSCYDKGMKIAIYDPYLDTLGGGEKYMLSLASVLSKQHSVFMLWDDASVLSKAHERFGFDVSKISAKPNIFSSTHSLIQKFLFLRQFDVCIYLSDGSIPWLFAKKNYIHLQFPVEWVHVSLLTRIKLLLVSKIICNSIFVKNFIDKKFSVNSLVLYPPVTLVPESPAKKEKIILTVGRFTQGMNMKKQAELLSAFKKLYDSGEKEYTFSMVGASLDSDKDFVEQLKKDAKGYPVVIENNVSFKTLIQQYQMAKIYWHGAGFGEDLDKYPERAEHFGISTVEAMSAGSVPLVYAGGGQVEVVESGVNGFVWKTEEELLDRTKQLIKDSVLLAQFSAVSKEKAKQYGNDMFSQHVKKILK